MPKAAAKDRALYWSRGRVGETQLPAYVESQRAAIVARLEGALACAQGHLGDAAGACLLFSVLGDIQYDCHLLEQAYERLATVAGREAA